MYSYKFKDSTLIYPDPSLHNFNMLAELHSGADVPASGDRARHISAVLPPGTCPTLPLAADRPARPTAARHSELTVFQELNAI